MRRLGSLENQLASARNAGFMAVEALESHLISAKSLRAGLEKHQLTCPSAHVSMTTLLQDRDRVAESCLQAGVSAVFVNPMPVDDPLNPTAWSRAGEKLARFAAEFHKNAIVLGYHNGARGFEPLRSGRCGIEDLYRSASGSPLKWQADIGWIRRARSNPVEWLQRLKAHLVSVHIKDVGSDPNVEDGWQDVGKGLLVWPILLRAAVRYGAQSFVVEHDSPPEPEAFARRSLSYLSKFQKEFGPPGCEQT